jgi:hypothetical protein
MRALGIAQQHQRHVYPRTLQITHGPDHVRFQSDGAWIEIYADKTVFQEDTLEIGSWDDALGSMQNYEQPVPSQAKTIDPLALCTCREAVKPPPDCWALSCDDDYWLELHLGWDLVTAFNDDTLDLPFIFELVDPGELAVARARIAALLGLAAPEVALPAISRMRRRVAEMHDKKAQRYIYFPINS